MKKSKSANILSITIILLAILGCTKKPAVQALDMGEYEFLSCNIDKVGTKKSLLLSEIIRRSDLVVFTDSLSRPEVFKGRINSIIASSKYIAISVFDEPTRLYDIQGQFIKLLDYGDMNQSRHRYSVDVQIDDQNDLFYILAPGGRVFQFGLSETKVREIPKYRIQPMGFTLISSTEFLAPARRTGEAWAYRQKIGQGSARLYYQQADEYISPNTPITTCIINTGNRIVVSFPGSNDTVFHFDPKRDILFPLFACYSAASLNRSKSRDIIGQGYQDESTNKNRIEKELVLMTKRFYIMDISEDFLVIDRQKKEAFFLSNLYNDLIDDRSISFEDDMNYWSFGYAATNGYFSILYNASELKNRVHSGMSSDSIQQKELISAKQEILLQLPDSAKVLLLNRIDI